MRRVSQEGSSSRQGRVDQLTDEPVYRVHTGRQSIVAVLTDREIVRGETGVWIETRLSSFRILIEPSHVISATSVCRCLCPSFTHELSP